MGRKRLADNGDSSTVKTPEQRAEERRSRFLKLADRRVNRTIKSLEAVGRFGNKGSYSMAEAEAELIVEALSEAFRAMVTSIRGSTSSKPKFSLK